MTLAFGKKYNAWSVLVTQQLTKGTFKSVLQSDVPFSFARQEKSSL